jgi:hypothetical protein
LIIPGRACAAARHQARLTVVDALQPDFTTVTAEQTTVFFIRYVFRHVNAYPDDAKSVDPVSSFAPNRILFPQTVNSGVDIQVPKQQLHR